MLTAHEWLNANTLRNFPLSERATLVDVSGRNRLPESTIVDLSLIVPETVTYPCRISQIGFTGRLFSLVIQDAADEILGAATVDIEESSGPYLTVPLLSTVSDAKGTLTLGPGRFDLPTVWPVGNLLFGDDGALLEFTTCIPVELGPVTSIAKLDHETLLRGDVKFIPGDNVSMSYDFELNAVCIEIKTNEAAFAPVCDSGCVPGECIRPPITRINGQAGTEHGCSFFIEGDGIVTVTERNGAIVIGSDTIRPADLCPNYTQAPDGLPGLPGPAGAGGGGGRLICGAVDCFCKICDVEAPLPPAAQICIAVGDC